MTIGNDSSEKNSSSESWKTPIIRVDGEAVGASIFLTKQDLEELGINVEDSEEIFYRLVKEEFVEIFNNR